MKETASVTRGDGLLEPLLARQRARQADRLITDDKRKGKLLDIGCGNFPYFLTTVLFREKYALDKSCDPSWRSAHAGIRYACHDMEQNPHLPYEDNSFDVVTLLALIEHIEPMRRHQVIREIHRILKPEGEMILTTPAVWTTWLLALLARVNLVSPAEIAEHKGPLRTGTARQLLHQINFNPTSIRHGYFEAWMNVWITARK